MRESTVRAAGTLPWRRRKGTIEVALVHRPRYDDWAWPKGKLDPDEDWTAAAVRETWEETGLRVRLGRPLPTSVYDVGTTGRRHRKEVRYWAAEVVGGDGALENEIDEIRWVTPARARALATYRRDLEQLEALVSGPSSTRTLAIVRHAHAVARKDWDGDDDRLRPLSDAGRARSADLVPLLAAYDIRRVVSSPSARCADTVRPYLAAAGAEGGDRVDRHADEHAPVVEVTWSEALSEEGFEAKPHKLPRVLRRALESDAPIALCTHRPVLDALYPELLDRVRTPGSHTKRPLRTVRNNGMVKGEVLVLHLTQDRVVAVERHTT